MSKNDHDKDCVCDDCVEMALMIGEHENVTATRVCPSCKVPLQEERESTLARKKGLIIIHWSGPDDFVLGCPKCSYHKEV